MFRYIGGGGRYSMTCQNLIDKYSGDSRTSQTTSQVSSSNLSSRSLVLIEDMGTVSGTKLKFQHWKSESNIVFVSVWLTGRGKQHWNSSDILYKYPCSRWLSKSCADLSSAMSEHEPVPSLRRSKSYSRITEERSAYEQQRESYRSTVRNMFTNLKDFSSRTVSAIGSDRTLKVESKAKYS